MGIQNEVQEFITRRFPTEEKWLNGNCYWFAFILRERFPELDLFYDPVEGHFYAGDGDVFYDWLGMYTKPVLPNIIKFSVIHTTDLIWYERILRDCKC